MARKKQAPETLPKQETEPPTENTGATPKPNTQIRSLVRPLPKGEWDTLVGEMHDYITTNNTLVERSLSHNREIAEKFTAYRKPTRGSGQTKSGIVLRDDILPKEPTPDEKINLNEFYKNGRIKGRK